ncbi:MAG: hypothetical protein ABSC06_02480 [Rhodopila sp.]|jgi:hypothetical protein
MTKVSERLGLTLANHYGLVEQLDLGSDIILLPHSILRSPLDQPYRAIRLIRDPRDIWVSGYLYHLRCDEEWCRNTDLDPRPPIQWPQVDYSVTHWPEDWKRRYLERLRGKSYQQNLLDRSLADGLDFELEGYTSSTFTAMREWALNQADALDVKLEDVMSDFDGAMRCIFDHFGFTTAQSQAALEVARFEDVRRMDDVAMAERPQIYSRTISKWRDVLSATQIARFEELHGDLVCALGYEQAGPVPSAPVQPSARRTGDAGIRLSADKTSIYPTNVRPGIYIFVVPSGSRLVLLKSRVGIRDEAPESGLGVDGRSLGIKVSQIGVRSDAGDVVVAADDPSLIAGWHDAEQVGSQLWRWTNGSAELPWGGVFGPAVVTIRCETVGEYAIDDA